MKRIIILFAVLALVLAGCGDPEPTVPSTTAATEPRPTAPAQERYAAARKAVENADNLVLEYTKTQSRTVGGNVFTEEVTGTASFRELRQDTMSAVVKQTRDFGVYCFDYAEAYQDGQAFALVNGTGFRAEMRPEDFAARQIPAVLLTESLYGSVTYQPSVDTVEILFAEPAALESWVGEAEMIEASGTATLDQEGNLMQSSYRARYSTAQVQYTLELTVKVAMPEGLDLSAVQIECDPESLLVPDLDLPGKLVQVVADVYCAQYVSCGITEVIHSEAIPMSYTQNSKLTLQGSGEALSADTAYEMGYSDYRGVVTERTQTECFRDGAYTVSIDGGEPVEDAGVDAEAMRRYCEDTILSGLFAMKYLKTVTVQTQEEGLRIEFAGNDGFCADLMAQLASFLQVDLDGQAQSYVTGKAGGYLVLDPQTGLPTAMGMYLERRHTLDGVSYDLSYRLDETVTFAAE